MDVDLKLLSGISAGICLFAAAGTAVTVPADVLTVSAGTVYTGDPLEATIQEADEGMPQTATLTLSLSSPLAPPLPTDLVLFDSLVQGSGLHRIHLVPGAGAGTLELQFSWGPDDRATNLTKALCLNTVGFGLSCLSETEPSQDLTDLFFPASASPERRTVPRHAPHPPRARAGAWCRDPHELGLCRTLAHKAPVALTR